LGRLPERSWSGFRKAGFRSSVFPTDRFAFPVRAEPASEDEAILDQAEQAREVRRALLKSPGSEPPGEKPDEGRPIRQAVKEQAEEVVTSVEQEDEEGPVELLPEANAPAEAARQGEEGDLEQPAAQAEPVGLEVPSRQPPAPVGPAGAEALSAQAVLQRALQAGASHIHIDPGPEHWSLRMRVDGVLHAMFPAAAGQLDEAAPRLTEQIRALAKMRESAGRPQRARQAVELAGRSVPLRVVTTPTVFGEKMVIQFPEVSGLVPDLSEMGLEEPDAARLAACLAQPNGMILCCGWPRSGTSALLLAMASQLSRHGMSVATIERKAGVGIEGLVQSRIDETGLGFAELLDGFLDQDVEAVMIESLRDPATAKRALAAAEEGVKVLAGLGAPSPTQAIALLVEMGLESWPLSCALTAVIAQSKARTLCPQCKKPSDPDAEVLRRLGLEPSDVDFETYEPVGCTQCFGTGYKGQTGIFASVFREDKLAALVRAMADAGAVSLASGDWGGRTLLEAGLAKVRAGAVSLRELARVLSA